MKSSLLLIVAILLALTSYGATKKSTSKGKVSVNLPIVEIQQIPLDSATINSNTSLRVLSETIKIKGFEKKTNDSRETFFIENLTDNHISRLKIKLRYSDIKGNPIHERDELIECNLPPHSTRQTSILSFDRNHTYYYFRSSKPRKNATQFRVAFQLMRYDVIVE